MATLAYNLSQSLEKGRCVAKEQWSNLEKMVAYVDILEGFLLPQVEDEIRTNYNVTVSNVALVAGNTQVTMTVSSYLITDLTAADTAIFLHKGDNYTSSIVSWSYASGNTSVIVSISGDQTSAIVNSDTAKLFHFKASSLDDDDEEAKNCLTPDEMGCISSHLNIICGTSYAPDFYLTTNNDDTITA